MKTKEIVGLILGILSVIAAFGINFEGTTFRIICGWFLGIECTIALILSIPYTIKHWNDPEPDAPNPLWDGDED